MMDYSNYESVIGDLVFQFIDGESPEKIHQSGDVICWVNKAKYPDDTLEHWDEIVDYAYGHYLNIKDMIIDDEEGGISTLAKNKLKIPSNPCSCWQLYYSNIHFSNKERVQIECKSILNQLSTETEPGNPVKGLVVGNIQSGKTLNMGGVISMVMDYRWNLIIVLSGTIESLRKQTERRLKKDVKSTTNVIMPQYREIKWLEIGNSGDYTETIKLDSDVRVYITVCLKQATDLKKLIRHINKNQDVKSQMRVLVIDDEADQASVNTSKLDDNPTMDSRNTINRRLIQLINGYDQNGKPAGPYKAMNYVAYTATPYANLLSENEMKGQDDEEEDIKLYSNLYPKDFIKLLRPAKEYFGPTQIFGYPPQGLEGLDIIDTSEDTRVEVMKMMGSDDYELPKGLKDALAWFICCVPIKRRWVKEQPISMLINPDMQTDIHAKLASAVEKYLINEKSDILSRCRTVYNDQKKKLTVTQFMKKMGCVDINGTAKDEDGNLIHPYCTDPSKINDYPDYDDIEEDIKKLISIDPKPYEIDDNKEITYHDGIHICIDNSKTNEMPRLIYPDKNDLEERNKPYPDPSPALIVIGGNTLSRGLTLEGLVSTYFSRNMTQADVSMQMCRWFGYRPGYELLPRMWMSANIRKKFLKAIDIDESLRKFMRENYDRFTPETMVAIIKNYPGLKATSRQKSRGAIDVGFDYSGYSKETTRFYTNPSIIENNMSLTREFLMGSKYKSCSFTTRATKSQWTYMDSDKVMSYLRAYKSPSMDRDFEDEVQIDLDRIEKKLSELGKPQWVVVVGNPSGSPRSWITLNGVDIGVSGRTSSNEAEEGCVEIGRRLINPRDQYADCDPNDFKNPYSEGVKSSWDFSKFDNHSYDKYAIREGCGRLDYPVLIIYCVSGPKLDGKYGLGLEDDVIGVCIQMPGTKSILGAATLLSLEPIGPKDPEQEV